MRATKILAMVVGLSLMPGCSWLFVQPLKTDRGYRNPNCTTNRAAPVIDTLFTTTNVVSALYVAGQDNVANKEQAVLFGLSVAALWAMSAGYGFSKTAECEEALAEEEEPEQPYRRPRYRAQPPAVRYPPKGSPAPPAAPYEAPPAAPYEAPPPPPAPPPVAATAPATPPVDAGAPPDAVVAPPVRPAPPAAPRARQHGDQEEP
jgi:hypothetical protein